MAHSRVMAELSERMWDMSDFLINTAGTRHHIARALDARNDDHALICSAIRSGKAAIAQAAIDTGRRVAWFALESLTAAVGRAAADGSVARTISKITRADLIVIDDIGMLPAGPAAAEALYRVIDAAYERRSVAVTSNLHPSGFDTIMPKP
jgi:IstB-like ATP binding protein